MYRLPPDSANPELDQAVVRQVITATTRGFLHRITDAISHPAEAAEPGTDADGLDPSPLPSEQPKHDQSA